MKYQTHVEDIIINNDNYEIVTDQYSEQFDGILITTPHQTFMKWFNHDQAFKYFNEMDSTSVATVVFAFDEKNIENTYITVLVLSSREQVIQILQLVLGLVKMAFTTPQGKVLIRAYVGKPGDTVVEDHTDEEIATIARRDLNKMMTFHGDPGLQLSIV